MKTKTISLKDKLNQIYGEAELDTTCGHTLTCCKVGCPQMNYCEFLNVLIDIWDNSTHQQKLDLILKSLEYFFYYDFEKFKFKALVKPCMLLDENKKACQYYESRCLNCRLYGLWPSDVYNARVDKFEKIYKGLIKREDIPLCAQCPNVKRNNGKALTESEINVVFDKLDKIDESTDEFTKIQIKNRENYRTLHDWILFKVLGESWLTKLTTIILASNSEAIEALLKTCKEVFVKQINIGDLDKKIAEFRLDVDKR